MILIDLHGPKRSIFISGTLERCETR